MPPLPAPKYKVELTEHNSLPALSFANPKGGGGSPCMKTFNPSYVEVKGQNKVGGVIVRTDGCAATKGSMSFAPCDVMTGVCGDLDPSYQINQTQGSQRHCLRYCHKSADTCPLAFAIEIPANVRGECRADERIDNGAGIQDPRVIYNQYDEYFYNFAFGCDSHCDALPINSMHIHPLWVACPESFGCHQAEAGSSRRQGERGVPERGSAGGSSSSSRTERGRSTGRMADGRGRR